MSKSPLATLKDKFGDKAKLVGELEKFTKDEDLWVSRLNSSKGLEHVSNAKLMRLHATFSAVKAKFGTRAKLIAAIADLEKRTKDEGYKARLGGFPVPRLWDMFQSAEKRNAPKKPAAKKKAAAPAPKAAVKKAPTQSAAAKKSALAKKKK